MGPFQRPRATEGARGPGRDRTVLEEGAKIFYARMAEQYASEDAGSLFRSLAAAEALEFEGVMDILQTHLDAFRNGQTITETAP